MGWRFFFWSYDMSGKGDSHPSRMNASNYYKLDNWSWLDKKKKTKVSEKIEKQKSNNSIRKRN